jgi:hypothetical protein
MKTPDPPAAIPAPTAKDQPFQIGDELTVYEAAMVYAGRHPYPHDFGPYDSRNKRERCLTLLKLGLSERLPRRQRAQRSWDIFCELGERVRQGLITPTRIARDLAGEVDLVETVIAIRDLVQLAIERGESPKYLRGFQTKTTTPRASPKMTKREEVKAFVDKNYPNGVDVSYRVLKLELSKSGLPVSDRTIRRALGRK